MDSLLDTKIQYTYFQYQKELGLPIFIRVDLSQFGEGVILTLSHMQFQELTEIELKSFDRYMGLRNSRLLTISEVTPQVAKQLYSVLETDRYGEESITSNDGHLVYRFKNEALMLYASYAREWKMGIFDSFGQENKKIEASSIINRFLSLSLAPFGIVGFWGVPVDEGAVILKQSMSKGEAVYIDVISNTFLSIDGHKKIGTKFCILKLSDILKGKNKEMGVEELFSFLNNYCTYFDPKGHSVPVRQMILDISKHHKGLIHPSESFRPRTDLAL